jgi:release factor glutamine methyltransferase
VTVAEAVSEGARLLEDAGIDTARLDTELLAAKALGLTRTELYLHPGRELSPGEVAALRALVARRARREPLAYVLGEWGFRRLTLKVDRRVLVPRPETEVVVEHCLDLLRDLVAPAVLDVGVGSGAIALAIVDEHPAARVTAIDVSEGALAVARENAKATGLEIAFEHRDVREGLVGRYDLVVSNPPYVTAEEIQRLEPEVRDWEPRTATVGDDHTEVIAAAAAKVLEPGGWLVLEVGDGQAGAVATVLQKLGYEDINTVSDLTGRDRVVGGRWGQSKKP